MTEEDTSLRYWSSITASLSELGSQTDAPTPKITYKQLGAKAGARERMSDFKLHAPFEPTGDQPQAIDKLVQGIEDGHRFQTLLGVTGSGKTFTMANVVEKYNRPTLVISHNKTLAAQLASEYRQFFPENATEYYVSYYD